MIWIKIHHLKGENTWKSSRRLDSNGLDIGSYWRTQSSKLIVQGWNIAFCSKRRLIWNIAFCSKRRLIWNIAFCSKRRLIWNIAFCSKRRLIRMSGTEK